MTLAQEDGKGNNISPLTTIPHKALCPIQKGEDLLKFDISVLLGIVTIEIVLTCEQYRLENFKHTLKHEDNDRFLFERILASKWK